MLIFFDTEFSDLEPGCRLISIGLVSENGQTFYAELSDTYQPYQCSSFVRTEVLPLLEGGPAQLSWEHLQLDLRNWIESIGQPVTLACDSLSWDWPWITQIFSPPGAWPCNLAHRPELLKQEDYFLQAVEEGHVSGLRRHHALDDAKANYLAWFAINRPNLAEHNPEQQ